MVDYKLHKIEDVTIVELLSDISSEEAAHFNEILRNIIKSDYRLILDMKGVNLINTPAISVLISVAKEVRGKGGDLKISNVNKNVMALFHKMQLEKIISLYDNLLSALSDFK